MTLIGHGTTLGNQALEFKIDKIARKYHFGNMYSLMNKILEN